MLIKGSWKKKPGEITAHYFEEGDPFGSMCGDFSDKGMVPASECESKRCERCKENLGSAQWHEAILRADDVRRVK